MPITPWDEIKAQVGYDELPTEGKVDTINKYSQYVQEYYTQVEPRDPREVGDASDEFVKIASQEALGDLGAVERGSAFLGNIYKGAAGTFTSAFRAAALAQQAIGESLGSYDDSTPLTERDLYKIAKNVDESVKQTTGIEDPRLRNDFINTLLPQGLGSALGFFGVAAAAAAAAPEAAAAGVGLGTAAALGAAANAGQIYEEAKQMGANEFVSRASAAAGGVVGLSEAIPLGNLAGRLTAGLAKRSILHGIIEGASEEFLQETGQQMANNLIASKFAGYDPNRGTMEGALQSGAVGLVTGGLIGGGVNAITRDNEAFYADRVSDEIRKKADLAASLTPERLSQIADAARNAGTTTKQRINIETGETESESTPKTVFGDRVGGEVPDIGENPAVNSVLLGRSVSQDAEGKNTETFTFHTPQGLLWEAEFKTGEPVKVRDVTDDSPLLNPITNPANPKTVTRSEFTGRIISPTSSLAKEFGLETEQEMDQRLIAEAQRAMQLGKTPDQRLLPDNQIIVDSVSRDDRGVARQVVLKNEIDRLYKIREAVLAKQILVGENPNAGTTEYDPNTASEVIRYDSEGNKIENKQEVSQRVARLNRMIGMRENELRGLIARPESYILASERNTPPSASQKLALVQGFQNLWNSISSPAIRDAITFEVGDITPMVESGQVPKGAVAYYKRASDGRKAMIFLSDKLATVPIARREMLHELGHAFWDTLPAGVQAEIRGLWKAETQSRTGALFDEFGGLKAEVSPRVMDSVQEFFSERLAWTNDNWAKGLSEQSGIMDKVGRAFRTLLDRFLRYTGHGERLNLEFRSFLDQGDRFKTLRTKIDQAVQAGRAGIDEEPKPSVRGLTGNENIQPKKERVGTTGQYVGMPEGINTPEKLQDLQDKLQSLTFEGEAGRFWYERSSEKILKIVGGSVKDAETLVAFIAAYSPQNRVYPNWGQALRAYAEYKRGQKITQGKTGRDIERGQRIADGERWKGIKTNNFYHNLMIRIDPAQTVRGATVDMWIMRVFGYKSDTPSATQYASAENTIKGIARKIGWEPQQVQAAMWVAGKAKWEDVIWPEIKDEAKRNGDLVQVENEAGKKKWEFKSKEIADEYRNKAMGRVFDKLNVDINEAAMDFSDMAKRNLATVSMETRFGLTTNERWQDNLSSEQLLQYHQQKEQILTDPSGINIVLREFGVPMDNMYNAVGLWKSQTNPLTQMEVPSYRDTGSKKFAADKNIKANLDDAISALGLLLKQDGMAYHQPYFDAQVKDSNGVEFRLGRKTTADETARLNSAFNEGYAIVNVRDGFRVLKFDDSMDNVAFHKDAKAKVESIFDGNQSIEMDRFAFDGNLIENDWSKNPNGENYRSRIKESGRSDIFGRIEDNLRPQIERLDAHWRGIAEAGGETGAEFTGRQGAGTQQSPQDRGIQEAGSPKVRASTRGEADARVVSDRSQRIQDAATAFIQGEISREEFNRIAVSAKPIGLVSEVQAVTDDEAISALDQGKQDKYGAARDLPAGTPVGLRIDIPAFKRSGVYVVTIHNQAEKGRVGKVIGYDKIAAVSNARFFVASQKVALSIAQGYSKTPLATVEGNHVPISQPPADIISGYQQVGYDPERFSYFYSKTNGNPIVSADEAILAGNTVFVKGAVEGNRSDFLYSTRGETPSRVLTDSVDYGKKDLRVPIEILTKDNVSTTGQSAIASLEYATQFYDDAVESGKHSPRRDEQIAREIAGNLLELNPPKLTQEKVREENGRGRFRNRAWRSYGGFIAYPSRGADYTTVIHETIHSLTADKLNKFGWFYEPFPKDGFAEGQRRRDKKGDYSKDMLAYEAWEGADPKIVRIIKLYKSAVEQLGVDKFYLKNFTTTTENKPRTGISIMPVRDGKAFEVSPIYYIPKEAKRGIRSEGNDEFAEPSWVDTKARFNPEVLRRLNRLEENNRSWRASAPVGTTRVSMARGFGSNVVYVMKDQIPDGADPYTAIKEMMGYGDKRTSPMPKRYRSWQLKEGTSTSVVEDRQLLVIDDRKDFTGYTKNKPLMNVNPDITTSRGGDYGFGNLDEFLAQAFSDSGTQEQLSRLVGDGERRSLWQSLVDAIRSLLGIRTDSSLLESVMDAAYDLAGLSRAQPANIVDVSDEQALYNEETGGMGARAPPSLQASVRGEQARQILEPVISFGRANLRTGGALPYDIFRIAEQRGFNANEKMLRAKNAIDDLDAASKRVYGRGLDKLTADESSKINEALQNPIARARLAPDLAAAVGNARNLLDSLSAELIRSGAIPDRLVPVVTANMGVYLTRAYEKWENPKFDNPFSKLPKDVQNRIESTVKGWMESRYAHAYAKEQSLARGERAIDTDSAQYQSDYQTGISRARNGGITKTEIRGYIDMLGAPEGESPFSQIGSGLTKDLSIITARKDIPPEIRQLWGEIKDPRVNFMLSMQRMTNLLETHNMLKAVRDAGMNKIFFSTPREGFSTKLVSQGSKTTSPLNMFIEGMSNDVYTSEEIAKAMQDTFGGRSRAQDALGKMAEWYLKANGISKFAKTVLSVQTQVRNLFGNAQFLIANGYIFSPDGAIAMRRLREIVLPAAGQQLGFSNDKALRDYSAKLTRLGILGQGVFANEMQSYFKDANINMATDFFDNYLMKSLKKVGGVATGLYQMGDSIPKAIAFEVELARLRRAYPSQPISKLETMAADKVLNLLPTYSRIPKLGNILRSQPFVSAFISFPLEVVRTGYNLIGTINEELRSDNPEIRKTGAYRLTGTMLATVGFSAAAAGLAAAMGVDDEDDKAIRQLDAPWDKYATKLYLGRDSKGNVQQVNLSYVDPYNYLRDPLIALVKADGTWDQKLFEAVKTTFEPFYGEQILAGKILDITRNKKGTTGGRVYNPEGGVFDKSTAIAGHMFDAFNIGTIASGIRVYRGLTGQVTPTGRAYDPALETLATVTGQRVVTLDPRQSISFAARKFNNRINDATGIFTAAYYDRSNVSEEARLQAYKDMMDARSDIFRDTSSVIGAAIRLGVSRGEIIQILRQQGVSRQSAIALVNGTVTPYASSKQGMKQDAIRYRQQALSATR